jgi:hypothetical protein
MDPTRIELDLPVVIINQYGHPQLENLKDIQDLVAVSFNKGSIITLHIIAEDTGATRGFCKFESTTSYGKSTCGFVLRSDGTCWRKDEHAKELTKQLTEDSD